MQDVDRTFPDIPYFTLERVKRCMVTMLFLFTVLNPDVGYRQVSRVKDYTEIRQVKLSIRECTNCWLFVC